MAGKKPKRDRAVERDKERRSAPDIPKPPAGKPSPPTDEPDHDKIRGQLELEKLRYEIKHLKHPYRQPRGLVSIIALIMAFGTLTGQNIHSFKRAERAELSLETAQRDEETLKQNVEELTRQREELDRRINERKEELSVLTEFAGGFERGLDYIRARAKGPGALEEPAKVLADVEEFARDVVLPARADCIDDCASNYPDLASDYDECVYYCSVWGEAE